jgi:hypothetical protein
MTHPLQSTEDVSPPLARILTTHTCLALKDKSSKNSEMSMDQTAALRC